MLFFFVIVIIPFILLVVSLVRPELVEQIIREPAGTRPTQTERMPAPHDSTHPL